MNDITVNVNVTVQIPGMPSLYFTTIDQCRRDATGYHWRGFLQVAHVLARLTVAHLGGDYAATFGAVFRELAHVHPGTLDVGAWALGKAMAKRIASHPMTVVEKFTYGGARHFEVSGAIALYDARGDFYATPASVSIQPDGAVWAGYDATDDTAPRIARALCVPTIRIINQHAASPRVLTGRSSTGADWLQEAR